MTAATLGIVAGTALVVIGLIWLMLRRMRGNDTHARPRLRGDRRKRR